MGNAEARGNGADREEMKALRAVRKETIRRVSARVKEQKKIIASISGRLKKGPGTVPEIAEAVGLPPGEVLWWIASLKKYGVVVEGEKQGAYFTYRLTD
ncbi:MAG: winged helix-turn-helix transcriptional regulator [Desulfacinum sp.]|nr:winged helix-turn-helix transcriptional regulator [Desulfacinum sp.]